MMSQNSAATTPNIVIPNTSEGRAIMSLMSQQHANINVVIDPQAQPGLKRKRPFPELAVPAVPCKKTRFN